MPTLEQSRRRKDLRRGKTMTAFGTVMSSRRRAFALTSGELAARAGVSPATISRLEKGKSTMRYLVIVFAVLLTMAGCATEAGVPGESCAVADDCESGRCEIGGSFPGGICTVACDSDADCPDGFACISRGSGICLQRCTTTQECEDQRGSDWQCREESLEEGGGNELVCIGD
jgi:transcriptional regulator with XRE-family HTH domain